MSRRLTLWLALAAACTPPVPSAGPTPTGLIRAESLYADLRGVRDSIDVTLAAGRHATAEGTPVDTLVGRYRALRGQVLRKLDREDPGYRM